MRENQQVAAPALRVMPRQHGETADTPPANRDPLFHASVLGSGRKGANLMAQGSGSFREIARMRLEVSASE
jgi:hypothetical protein